MKLKLPKLTKFPRLPKFPKLPKLSLHLPKPNIEPVRKIVAFVIKHKISLTILVAFIAFIIVAMWYRGYLLAKMSTTVNNNDNEIFNSTSSNNPLPSIAIPSPTETPSSGVLGASNSYNPYAPVTVPTPYPTFAPLPTLPPLPTITMPVVNTSSNNSSGNPNCTTGSGAPNSWYSDVYPNPSAASTSTGSITMYVYIRDCNQNTAPVKDKLTISLSSGDSNTQINGNKLPYSVTTQDGYVKFSVSSQVTGTVTLIVHDDSSNFTVTNINNQNPAITFTTSASGNSNCTTAAGVANFWYSEVSPASPISASTGSTVTLTVDIKDCSQNDVSSDKLTLTQTSSDSSVTVNGYAPPITVQAQNGKATFNVISQNAGTDTFTIQDATSNFTVTDAKNQNPSIIFSGSSTSPTPTPTPTPTVSPSPTVISSPSASPIQQL
jgi:hypothetical protein